jgi:hypothetical protein
VPGYAGRGRAEPLTRSAAPRAAAALARTARVWLRQQADKSSSAGQEPLYSGAAAASCRRAACHGATLAPSPAPPAARWSAQGLLPQHGAGRLRAASPPRRAAWLRRSSRSSRQRGTGQSAAVHTRRAPAAAPTCACRGEGGGARSGGGTAGGRAKGMQARVCHSAK